MRLLSAALLPALLARGELPPASCPSDGSLAAASCAAGLAPERALQPGAAAVQLEPEPLPPQRALVDQEISNLRDLIGLCRDRLSVLRELRGQLAVGGAPQSLPEAHAQALQDDMPPVWEVAGNIETSQAAAAGDFLVTKAMVPLEEPVAMIRWLPLRSMRTSGPASATQMAMPSVLLVAVQADSTVRLFTSHGELALSFSAGHEAPLVQLAVSPLHDEYIIATCDVQGLVRTHRIHVRQRRIGREERQGRTGPGGEKVSQHLGLQANVTAQFAGQMHVPGVRKGANLTAFIMASQQGTKYFIAGDSRGGIAILTRNGTLHSELVAPGAASVDSINAHVGNIVFVAGGEWGFIDLERFEVRRLRCNKFEGRISAAIVDTQLTTRVLATDDAGAVWVFNVRDKRSCKIEHRFSALATRPPVKLASIRGFVLALDQSTAARGRISTVAFNLSHSGKKKMDPERASSAIVWRRWGPPARDWTVHKRYQQGDIAAYLSADGLEIEVVEILMHVYTPLEGDTLGNFKLPVFAVAIMLVLGYQYVKQQGAFDPGLMESE